MPIFVHTADLHLNALKRFTGYLDRPRLVLPEITAIAAKHDASFILVVGDVYHTQAINHAERTLFSDWLGSSPIPIVVISGNHEKRTSEVGDTALNYLSGLGNRLNPHRVWDGAPTIMEVGGCSLILLPYQGWKNYELQIMLPPMIEYASSEGLPVVVAMHEHVRGAKTDRGHKLSESEQIKISKHLFPGVTYWALGDIHSRQAILPNAWYSGPPLQTKFDETPDKGVLVVDTDDPENPIFEPIESPPLLQVKELPSHLPDGAYLQLDPDEPLPRGTSLPPNVELHPKATVFSGRAEYVKRSGNRFNPFEGLTEQLRDSGLKPKARERAWKLVEEIGSSLGVEVVRD
jgi:DNA repair exonuclease SbcCD nuclease subunit